MDASQVVLKLVLDTVGQEFDLAKFDQRLAIQKKMYFAQLTGIDLGYRFGWYRYGPYCTELTGDAFRLQDDFDRNDEVPEGAVLNDAVAETLRRAKTIWTKKPESESEADWLELLASVHYLKHIAYIKAPGKKCYLEVDGRDFDIVFKTLSDSKPQFTDREDLVQQAWDQLNRVGLVENKMLPAAQ